MSKRGAYVGYVPFGNGDALAFVDPYGLSDESSFDLVFANYDEIEPDEFIDDELEIEIIEVAELPGGYSIYGTKVRGSNLIRKPFFVVGPNGGTLARGFWSIAAALDYARQHALKRRPRPEADVVKPSGP